MPQIPQYTQQVEASTRGLPEPHASPTGIGTATSTRRVDGRAGGTG